MTDDFEKALGERSADVMDFCYCAGPTCSGCEVSSVKLFSMGAMWAREWFERKIKLLKIQHQQSNTGICVNCNKLRAEGKR